MNRIEGRVFRFGDDIDTDVLAPGYAMKLPLPELARHCLEAVDPGFAGAVRPGDFILAGRNFGLGSSREQAAQVLKALGIGAVLAKSFARIFYRNAINFALPAIVFPQADEMAAGERLVLDLAQGRIEAPERGASYRFAPLPPHVMAMIEAGGLLPHLKARLSAGSHQDMADR